MAVPGVPLFYSRFASMSLVGDQKSCGQEYEGDTDFSTSTFVQPAALSEDLIWFVLSLQLPDLSEGSRSDRLTQSTSHKLLGVRSTRALLLTRKLTLCSG